MYDFTLDSTKVSANTGGGAMASNEVDTQYRLFGDFDGDRHVNVDDYNAFLTSFGKASTNPAYMAWFDYDASNFVNVSDYNQFDLRFGHSVGGF